MNPTHNSQGVTELLAVIDDPSRATVSAASPELWQKVKREAELHGLSAVLATRCGPYLPAGESAWLNGVVAMHLASHHRRLQELKSILAALEAEGIRAVALKGPILAERLGETFRQPPFLKLSADLDILVDEANIHRAIHCLERTGYEEESHELPWRVRRRRFHHVTLHASPPYSFASVDLHYRLAWQHAPIGARDLLDRSEFWTAANGAKVRVLDAADEAILLANHAALHFFTRLAWLYDANMVFRKLSPVERSRVLSLAGKAGKLTMLAATNRAAVEFFHEPLLSDLPSFPAWPRFQREAIRVQQFQHGMAWRQRCYQHLLARKLGLQLAGSPRDFFAFVDEYIVMPAFAKAYSLLRKNR